ncbi:MAG: hypothetical protein IKQ69_10690 [Oscillospiraceae bacterium]|nr:hypothetical protein [Oscillospiraceae bacterium]
MTRKGFMSELKNLLLFLDTNDRARVLKHYERMFDEAGAEGEDALIRCLGSPVRQVLQIEQEYREAVDKGEIPFAEEDVLPAKETRPAKAPAEPEKIVTESAPEMPASAPPDPDPFAEVKSVFGLPAEKALPEEPEEEPPLFTDAAERILQEPDAKAEFAAPAAEEEPEPVPVFQEPAPPAEEPTAEETVPFESAPEPDEAPAAEEARESLRTPEEEADEDEDDEDDEDDDYDVYRPGAGRIFASVLVTFPMLPVWILCFGIFLLLGVAALAAGVGFGAAAIYLMSYVFSGVIVYTPDLILLGGGAVVASALALLLIWMGLWIMIGGFGLIFRMTGSIYGGILGNREED